MSSMPKVSISDLIRFRDSSADGLHDVTVAGDLLLIDRTAAVSNDKSYLTAVLSDGTPIKVVFVGLHGERSIINYIQRFTHKGIRIELAGLSAPTPAWKREGIDFCLIQSANFSLELAVRGCPSFNEWKKSDLDRPLAKLPTAAEILLREAEDEPKRTKDKQLDNEEPLPAVNRLNYRSQKAFSESEDQDLAYDLGGTPEEENANDIEITDYSWFLSPEGEKLLTVPIMEPIFITEVKSVPSRLATVFRFNPPDHGLLAVYWLAPERKWLRIIEVRANTLSTYLKLKNVAQKIADLEELQTRLKLTFIQKFLPLEERNLGIPR